MTQCPESTCEVSSCRIEKVIKILVCTIIDCQPRSIPTATPRPTTTPTPQPEPSNNIGIKTTIGTGVLFIICCCVTELAVFLAKRKRNRNVNGILNGQNYPAYNARKERLDLIEKI